MSRKLGHFPVDAELRRESARNEDLPSYSVWSRKLGDKNARIQKVVKFCRQNPDEYQDVLDFCEPFISGSVSGEDDVLDFKENEKFGYVYLSKSGKHYRIGCTNNLDRRHEEVKVQLPEDYVRIHSIQTDDPYGIEAYWQNRFKDESPPAYAGGFI